jgi:hypothetical protein
MPFELVIADQGGDMETDTSEAVIGCNVHS